MPSDPHVYTVATAAELDAAIRDFDLTGAGAAPQAQITVTLTADIPLPADLTAINLPDGARLTLLGNGHTLDGGGQARGLFVYAGTVDIVGITIAETLARGGDGGHQAGGGGAGLGGGLFVAAAGTVSLRGVSFANGSAIGGTGGEVNAFEPTFFGAGGGGGGGLGGNGGDGGLVSST